MVNCLFLFLVLLLLYLHQVLPIGRQSAQESLTKSLRLRANDSSHYKGGERQSIVILTRLNLCDASGIPNVSQQFKVFIFSPLILKSCTITICNLKIWTYSQLD